MNPLLPAVQLYPLVFLFLEKYLTFFSLQLCVRSNPRSKCRHKKAKSAISKPDSCQESLQRTSPHEVCQPQKCKFDRFFLGTFYIRTLGCQTEKTLFLCFNYLLLTSTDHRPPKCIFTTKVIRGIPRCVSNKNINESLFFFFCQNYERFFLFLGTW